MEIVFAKVTDAPIIHNLMQQAFIIYKNEVPPSSALDETIHSISTVLQNGEQALISYIDNQSVGMVRFQLEEEALYFFRLSVIPDKQGQGIAKKLLKTLEAYALQREKSGIKCKVRMSIPQNISLYHSISYTIYDEETLSKPNGITLKVVSMMKSLT